MIAPFKRTSKMPPVPGIKFTEAEVLSQMWLAILVQAKPPSVAIGTAYRIQFPQYVFSWLDLKFQHKLCIRMGICNYIEIAENEPIVLRANSY